MGSVTTAVFERHVRNLIHIAAHAGKETSARAFSLANRVTGTTSAAKRSTGLIRFRAIVAVRPASGDDQ